MPQVMLGCIWWKLVFFIFCYIIVVNTDNLFKDMIGRGWMYLLAAILSKNKILIKITATKTLPIRPQLDTHLFLLNFP